MQDQSNLMIFRVEINSENQEIRFFNPDGDFVVVNHPSQICSQRLFPYEGFLTLTETVFLEWSSGSVAWNSMSEKKKISARMFKLDWNLWTALKTWKNYFLSLGISGVDDIVDIDKDSFEKANREWDLLAFSSKFNSYRLDTPWRISGPEGRVSGRIEGISEVHELLDWKLRPKKKVEPAFYPLHDFSPKFLTLVELRENNPEVKITHVPISEIVAKILFDHLKPTDD